MSSTWVSLAETCSTCQRSQGSVFSLYHRDKRACKHGGHLLKTAHSRFCWRHTYLCCNQYPFQTDEDLKAWLTHFRHLRHCCYKGSIWKFRCIIIDVLYFNDELRLWFQGLFRVPIQGLRMQDIMRFLFAIQALGGMDISCHFVNDEYSPSSFPVQNVPDRSVTFIRVWVKLQRKSDKRCENTNKRCVCFCYLSKV